jgi:uridine kinase
VALVLLALGRLVFSTRIRLSGLLFGSGFLLGCLVLTTNAHPGWYLWIVPFLALFFANYVTAPSLIFVFMIGIYLVHFVLEDWLVPPYSSLSFTLLQVCLLVQLLVLYWLNLRHEAQLKNRLRPMMLGLSGDSGAGKNHLCQTIQSLLDPNNCIVIEGDNYHKWERGDKNWETLTHLNPNANNLFKMQAHAIKIARGQPILHHHYDHTTGRFIEQPTTNPTKSIIFQGLHSLYLKSLREILDLKIFLDPNEKVRTFWKIQRDVFERGHSLEKVLDSLEKRRADSQLHIQPQKNKSDWVIEITTDENFDPTQLNKNSRIPLYIKYTLFNDEPITDLITELQSIGLTTTLDFLSSDLDKVIITIKGHPNKEQNTNIAWKLFPQMRHITRSARPPQFLAGLEGIHQLFILALLNKRLEV